MHSSSSTLHSKLNVVIARTSRAENLYDSLSPSAAKASTQLKSLTTGASANIWKKLNANFRSELNNLVRISRTGPLLENLTMLYESYYSQINEVERSIAIKTEALNIALSRQEYAKVLLNTVSLIEYKSKLEALRLITDELAALIGKKAQQAREDLQQDILEKNGWHHSAGVGAGVGAVELSPPRSVW